MSTTRYLTSSPQSSSQFDTQHPRHLSHKKENVCVVISACLFGIWEISTHRVSSQDLRLEKGVQGSSRGAWFSQLSIAQLEASVPLEASVLRSFLDVVDPWEPWVALLEPSLCWDPLPRLPGVWVAASSVFICMACQQEESSNTRSSECGPCWYSCCST